MTEFRKEDSRWKGVFSSSYFPDFFWGPRISVGMARSSARRKSAAA